MKTFTRFFTVVMVFLLSSSLVVAQLQLNGPASDRLPMGSRSFDLLYTQNSPGSGGSASQDFETAYDLYDCQGADDFYVPSGLAWTINQVVVGGSYSATGPFDLATVSFFDDNGGVPSTTAFEIFVAVPCIDISGTGDLQVELPTAVTLAEGHYWVSVQGASDFATNGQWYWTRNGTVQNDEAVWRCPADGFGNGFTTFTPLSTAFGLAEDFMFSLYGMAGAPVTCDYQVSLTDQYGDGWNGGYIDLFVNGTLIFDNLTLPSGYGPSYDSFTVMSGDEITTTYTAGGWSSENTYEIIDSEGNVVYTDGPGYTIPSGIGPGMLSASCPMLPGAIEGYVFNYDGLSISGAIVELSDGTSTTTGPNGYYLLEPVPVGDNLVTAYKTGYNSASATVNVASSDTAQQDFVLTQPTLVVTPLTVEEIVHPNQYYSLSMGVLNNGTGPLHWMAEIVYPDDASGPHLNWPQTTGTRAYCAASGGCDEYISNVAFGDINNSSACTGYGDYTDQSTVVAVGETYAITITNGNPIWTADECGIWVDWNQNEVFDDAPISVSGSPGVGPYTANITVPDDALPGPTRIRIRIDYANTPSPCGTTSFGEAEDYTVIVTGAGNWLSMDYYEGDVPGFGGTNNIPTHMDASGTEAGEVYNADIVFTSLPNVGTITVPVTMIIAGDPLIPAEELEVELVDDLTGEAMLSWMWSGPGSGTFEYFLIKRSGQVVATTTNMSYIDMLPDYGEYCYTVEAVYQEGSTAPAGPECVLWPLPELTVFPTSLEGWVWPDHQITVNTTITNTGTGTLSFTFPDFTNDFTCTHTVILYDDFGDGWNGATLDVFVNGAAALTNITISSGSGPEEFPFIASDGDEITTTYNINGNSWPYENEYEIIDGTGAVIATDGMGGVNPTGIGPGQCYGNCPVPGFIVDVNPPSGFLGAGTSQQVAVTYDATSFPVGDYMEDLMLESNDPSNPEVTIDNTMHVYMPAHYAGTVTNLNTNQPLPGAEVSAGMWTTTTGEDGTYMLFVDEGTYDVYFEKVGFQTVIVADTFAAAGMTTPIDVGMWDAAYPPAGVVATVQDDDTWCLVEWMLPQGPYELQMDDGSAEDFAVWAVRGSQNAVKFTPNGYPATVIGGRFYVGDGSFPGPFLGTEFSVVVYDDDGTDGMPGTMVDSGGVTVNNYGWVDIDWLSAEFTEGDFYLAMWQTANSPNTAPLGIDTDLPTYYMSYSKFQENDWTLSAYQDFMIRAWVSGPQSDVSDATVSTDLKYPAKPVGYGEHWYNASGELPRILPGVEKTARARSIEGQVSRDIVNYRVGRYSNFDPNLSPETGDLTELASTGNLMYEDYAWAGLAQGWYAYGVKTLYTSGDYSDWAVSNIVGHLMDFEVTVNVTLTTGDDPINVEVTLQGLDYPYETYFAVTPASGTVVFDPVWLGNYSVAAYKIGYDLYKIDNIFINADTEINIVLQESTYPPTNLYVDPLTLEATWNEPFITELMEDFESATFPPTGWQSLSDGEGWFRTADGSSASFPIPSWDSYYACNNDDGAGSTNPGANDYLITPALDLRVSDGFMMSFDSYYDGSFSQLAFVEYTTDGGATWEVLYQLPPAAGAWSMIELDLAAFSGANAAPQTWFAFHADDAGQWASGWAVDNPVVQVPDPAANYIDFHVFLDGAFVGATEETNWNYAPLDYGVEYEASVAARYTSGLSEKDYYTFLCTYLIPPRNLVGAAPDDAAILLWEPPLEFGDAFTVISDEPRSEFPNVNSEYSPRVRQIEGGSATRDPWDLQFSWATADNSGEAGAESDGDYFYTTMWNGSGFQQYELDGTYVGPVSAGGASGLRDVAYDDGTGHMFGGAATTTVNEMDLAAGTLIGTFTAPTDVRAIAYDPVFDGFWANNWSTTITLFDKTGAQLNSFPVGSFGSYYGFAHDEWTEGGPYLWGFSQDGSGNVIVQIEIATGLETGFTQDVSGLLITGTGIAGGLFTHPGVFASDKVTIGGNAQNDVFFGYELEDYGGGGPGPGTVPANLLGYNIYRDGNFVDYVSRDFLTYVDEGLAPAIYQYTITGVYDLTPYGFPGEEGESMEEGPAQVVVDYCYDLEFMEDFSLGTFDANGWDAAGNWAVNGQSGNPMPSAEFSWDPIQSEYSATLTSYPLCAQGITEGDVWLDFDLMLDSYVSTGEEYLLVEVWNWDSQEWTTIATFSNLEGNLPWEGYQYQINTVKGKVFKVRFNATGMNSLDILGWNVDNIHIYRTCAAPTELTAEEYGADFDDILLTWKAGGGVIDEWIHYDDGTNFSAIGTNAAAEFDAAVRWEPAQLADYEGTSVTEVAFFPAEAAATYSIRVWTGAGAANLVVDQTVTNPLIGQWNYITLDTPLPIDISQELWVGYYVNTTTGYPAGTDAGPAIDGYGNMMNFGGWQTLLQINPDLDYNWNIQAHVVTSDDDSMVLPAPITQEEYTSPAEVLGVNPNHVPLQPFFGAGTGVRILTGFNIYRSEDGGAYELLTYVEDDGSREYIDENLVAGVIYCYMVTAVYESDIDFCESDYSIEACDWVTVGIDELAAGSFRLYPNPAKDYTKITSSDELQRITVYTTTGKLMLDEEVTGNEYELKTSVYTPGAYLVKVETISGVNTRMLNIQR